MSSNITSTNEIASYDTQGAIIYIIGVIIWYGTGFGLILFGDIRRQSHHIRRHQYRNVYQAVNDLNEQRVRNDILIELKDNDKRKKLWNIYYGTKTNPSITMKKDKETVHSITKQLDELTEQRRLLQNTLHDLSFDQTDDENDKIKI
ncbi:hypothetical protein I4U23_013241 [Adineta vaga]|nr:hypothetical protein I4U23_013241 [Adineta vaga]